MYQLFADSVLSAHVAFVAFVVLMVPLILIGGARAWSWVRCPLLRWCHLAGIVIVAMQSWFGVVCPLTTFEMWLRRRGGESGYSESFIEHWMQRILYWDLPWWVFILIYTVFAGVVISTWFLVPPRRFKKSRSSSNRSKAS